MPGNCHVSSGAVSGTGGLLYGNSLPGTGTRQAGIEVVTEADDRATVVLLGFDTENTSEKIRNTCIMLGKDVAYLATNPDLVCPVSFGYIPDCGSMSIMLKNATWERAIFY